ncbi:MAG: hypothetical protein KOO62_02240 [candidate division Zixibacteria bacterium]|nr:hypothetical protein [candidate division Zixibacteria bacterium]
MQKILAIIGVLVIVAMLMSGCDKERIVTSTEVIHDIEYVQLPPDTVIQYDTVSISDPVTIYEVDTVILYDTTSQNVTDTVYQVNTVYDTVVQMTYVYDTIVQVDHIYDTIVQYEYVHTVDTVEVTDTVTNTQCSPNETFATTAMEYHCNPLVLEMINQEFGYTDGWVLYLTEWQVGISQPGTGTYDIHGYIDYWTPDWSAYYPIEYSWRLSYVSGDPAIPTNWQMSEPPTAVAPMEPGVSLRGTVVEAVPALK